LSLVSFRTPCCWDILRGRSIATRDTHSDEYWNADEISSESGQNRFFKYVSTALCSTDQRSMAAEILWVSPERALKDKFLTPTVPIATVWKIVRYFCLTLEKSSGIFAWPCIRCSPGRPRPRNLCTPVTGLRYGPFTVAGTVQSQ
jgi:hypothetical protein